VDKLATKIVVTGAAGLVGQNLMTRLKTGDYCEIVAIDKHPANTNILRKLHPHIRVIEADLASANDWEAAVADADVIVVGHAQIGGIDRAAFVANNIIATDRLIKAVRVKVPYVVQISSSVVESTAGDWYIETKREQERIIRASELPNVILRPTLMFGWFDRKHLGWLALFMQKTPFFPIPGHGRYLRQPLYCGDLCDIIISCIAQRPNGVTYNISGLQQIDYIDLMYAVRDACKARATIVRIPYSVFWQLLRLYALFDHNPPFTTKQLEALVTPDVFEVLDWPTIFGVKATPLHKALEQTFRDPLYSKIVLGF